MSDVRLIERWMPVEALGEESVRERRSMTALPPTYYLHVWWARRPLVASRAAILASLLPANADREKFMRAICIHGNPVAAKRLMDQAKRKGERISDPYGYPRAFSYTPDAKDKNWIKSQCRDAKVLDPTAGGGSIPFEAKRLGLQAFANDLNPVAASILSGTVDFPFGDALSIAVEFENISKLFRQKVGEKISWLFPKMHFPDQIDATYLWARTISCPYCSGIIPLSPNWRLAADGRGVRLKPALQDGPFAPERFCEFEIVENATE